MKGGLGSGRQEQEKPRRQQKTKQEAWSAKKETKGSIRKGYWRECGDPLEGVERKDGGPERRIFQ